MTAFSLDCYSLNLSYQWLYSGDQNSPIQEEPPQWVLAGRGGMFWEVSCRSAPPP